jgi:exodeoxyribonuclease V alpha subunit
MVMANKETDAFDENAKDIEITGPIAKLFYSRGSFSAGIIIPRRASGDDRFPPKVTFAGPVEVDEKSIVTLVGDWSTHPKYGKQFRVAFRVYDIDISPAGLAKYIANNPQIKHIGDARARKIAQTYGKHFEAALRDNPDEVAHVAGVNRQTIDQLAHIWFSDQKTNAARTWLAAQGLTHNQICKLIAAFGTRAKVVLTANPYLIIGQVPGLGFARVDKIARALGIPKNHPERIKQGVLHVLKDMAENGGHTWAYDQQIIDSATALLVMDDINSRDLIEQAIYKMCGTGELATVGSNPLGSALTEYYWAEHKVSAIITGYNAEVPDQYDDHTLFFEERLSPEQKHAVLVAMINKASVITGGAGTGKSTAILEIVQQAESRGDSIALCAPTGKAAKRIEEAIRHKRPAKTIHRLLGFNGEEFYHHRGNPIDADLVVCDEFSMVDVELAARLFDAIHPDSSVVIVGDHNQLPPVGPGSVLRDLIASDHVPKTILTTCHRQAGNLKAHCAEILEGKVHPTDAADMQNAWIVWDQLKEAEDIAALVERIATEYAPRIVGDVVLDKEWSTNAVFPRDFQILTPTHKGPLGRVALNRMMQRVVQRNVYGVDVGEFPKDYYVGDKVIQTKNNYDRNIMNGSAGEVIQVDATGSVTIDFDGVDVTVEPFTEEYQQITLAYALTIHKSQGSEYPVVLTVCHKSHTFQHHRNLLYTAVTRARNVSIIVGDKWGIRQCAKKIELDKRRTLLPMFLSQEVVG